MTEVVAATTGNGHKNLTAQQVSAVEALLTRRPDETIESVAERAGCSRVTIWRWMQREEFVKAYRQGVELTLGVQRSKVAAALVLGAITPGPGQAAMQKLYWQRLGELVEHHKVEGEIQHTHVGIAALPEPVADETEWAEVVELKEVAAGGEG